MRWDAIADLMGRAHALVENEDFWEYQSEGLALFIAPSLFRMFKLPVDVPVLEVVSDSFHVLPLLQILDKDENFYVLAVSENDVRLYDATKHSFEEVEIGELPNSMAEALWKDDPERHQQWHSSGGASSGGGLSTFSSGSGNLSRMEKHKADYKQYFKAVNDALESAFRRYPAPVVLAGVAYLLPIYRSVNTIAEILDGEVHGNKDRTAPSEIHKAAWDVAAKHFALAAKDTRESFEYALSQGTASSNPIEIASAARDGRVAQLFVSTGGDNGVPSALKSSKINEAALSTLNKGGAVFALAPQDMPLDLPMAATFRY